MLEIGEVKEKETNKTVGQFLKDLRTNSNETEGHFFIILNALLSLTLIRNLEAKSINPELNQELLTKEITNLLKEAWETANVFYGRPPFAVTVPLGNICFRQTDLIQIALYLKACCE